jgi:hypothetical protein
MRLFHPSSHSDHVDGGIAVLLGYSQGAPW